jgi:hypothetical protein
VAKLGQFFDRLDKKSFLHFHVWEFAYRSFFKEYARLFFYKAMIKHPIETAKGLRDYHRFIKSQENLFPRYQKTLAIPDEKTFRDKIAQPKSGPLLGLGFCLKPHDPKDKTQSCPSGRANHECLYLEKGKTKNICRDCAIYTIAKEGLSLGCPVYIMTSAQDIARDFLIPQIDNVLFPSAILLLCPYSVQAILPSLFICGIDAFLLAYESGYCKDYKEWRLADLGTKEERTTLSRETSEKLFGLFDSSKGFTPTPSPSFRREGNIYYPGKEQGS